MENRCNQKEKRWHCSNHPICKAIGEPYWMRLLETGPSSAIEMGNWSCCPKNDSASLEKRSDATVAEWGDLAWLKAFDAEDLDAFCDELYDLLITCAAMDDFDALDESIREWKTTAGQLEDPLRRRILLSDGFDDEDFVAASAPSDERKAD